MEKLALILAAMLWAACSEVAAPPAEPDCVPPGPEAGWCHHLDNDTVSDTLIPLPPDSV